ncbi:MAG: hypothetical protein MUE72_02935 [Chitinophagaceae bacterium]|nr:hypothetical protein [Chitinophagaceae bacterium]
MLVKSIFPLIDSKGSVTKYESDTLYIYYLNNVVVYEIPKMYTSTKILNGDIKNSQTEFKFFSDYWVFNKENNKSVLFKKNKIKDYAIIPKDSFMNEQWFSKTKTDELFNQFDMHLLDSTISNQTLKKKYYAINKLDTSIKGKVYFIFSSKFNDAPFTISKKLDSIHKMKLIGFDFVNAPRYIKKLNLHITEEIKEGGYEMTYDNEKNMDAILKYIKEYKKIISKN